MLPEQDIQLVFADACARVSFRLRRWPNVCEEAAFCAGAAGDSVLPFTSLLQTLYLSMACVYPTGSPSDEEEASGGCGHWISCREELRRRQKRARQVLSVLKRLSTMFLGVLSNVWLTKRRSFSSPTCRWGGGHAHSAFLDRRLGIGAGGAGGSLGRAWIRSLEGSASETYLRFGGAPKYVPHLAGIAGVVLIARRFTVTAVLID